MCLERKLNANKLLKPETFAFASVAEIALGVEIMPFDLKERLISDSPEKAWRRHVKAVNEVLILDLWRKKKTELKSELRLHSFFFFFLMILSNLFTMILFGSKTEVGGMNHRP